MDQSSYICRHFWIGLLSGLCSTSVAALGLNRCTHTEHPMNISHLFIYVFALIWMVMVDCDSIWSIYLAKNTSNSIEQMPLLAHNTTSMPWRIWLLSLFIFSHRFLAQSYANIGLCSNFDIYFAFKQIKNSSYPFDSCRNRNGSRVKYFPNYKSTQIVCKHKSVHFRMRMNEIQDFFFLLKSTISSCHIVLSKFPDKFKSLFAKLKWS